MTRSALLLCSAQILLRSSTLGHMSTMMWMLIYTSTSATSLPRLSLHTQQSTLKTQRLETRRQATRTGRQHKAAHKGSYSSFPCIYLAEQSPPMHAHALHGLHLNLQYLMLALSHFFCRDRMNQAMETVMEEHMQPNQAI
jgi:hypothetical protein